MPPVGRRPSLLPAGLLVAGLALATGLRLGAQNQMPADGPAPTIAPAMPRAERLHQLLAQPDYRDIAQYLEAKPVFSFGPLGRLQAQARQALPRVQDLLSMLRDPAAEAGGANGSAEVTESATRLERLELRLRCRLWVEQLGAADWHQRAAAAVFLDHLGRQAVPELTWGLSSADPEVAAACLQLLVRLRGRGYIGISFVVMPPALSTEEAAKKGLPFIGGVEVDTVQDGFPGATAGLKGGDIIIGLGPLRIVTWSDLLRGVDRLGPETPTTVTVVRDGKIQTLPIKLGTRPDNYN